MARRRALVRRIPAVARILADVAGPDDPLAAESRRKDGRIARIGKLREGLAGGSRQRIEQVGFAAVVGDVVEERAEPGAGQLRRGVGDGLHQRFEIDLGGQHAGGPVENFEPMRLVAQDRGGLRAPSGQLDMAGDTGEQLAGAERLGQIIVGPGPQALDLRLLAGPRGQQNDRDVAQRRIGAQALQKIDAVHHRHHDVAQDEIVPGVRERRERRLSVGDRGNVVPGAQQAREIVPHVRVIVRHQNPRGVRDRRRKRLVGGIEIVGGIGQPAQGFADE